MMQPMVSSIIAGSGGWLVLLALAVAAAAAAWLLFLYRRWTVERRPPGALKTVSVDPQPFEHVQLREVVMVAALALAVYLLIPQLADVTGVWSSIRQADWLWALWALLASALTFVAAAIGLMGAVPQRLPLPTTTAAQLAGSFVNRIVPARMGGMATNLRYLQKRGVDLAVATASIGVQQVSGIVVHVALSAILLVWAGRNASDALEALPSGQTVLIGLTVLGALSGLAFLLPWGRRLLRARVLPPLQRSLVGVAAVARSPVKLLELFGGAVFLTAMNIAALVSVRLRVRSDRRQRGRDRRRVPRGLRRRLGRPDPGQPRRRGGGPDRRPHDRRREERRRRPGRLPLPDRHVLAADPAGLADLRPAAAPRRSLTRLATRAIIGRA